MRIVSKLLSKLGTKKVSRHLKWLKLFKLWQLVVLFVILLAGSVWSLRQNNLKMVELRGVLIEADTAGENVEGALKELGDHIVAHMNTSMAGPVELVNSFNRDYENLVLQSEELTNAEYLKIREKCVTFDVPVEIQAECIRNETNLLTSEEVSLPSELYSFDFRSPFWSPDLAGFLTLTSASILLLIFTRIFADYSVKRLLKHHR